MEAAPARWYRIRESKARLAAGDYVSAVANTSIRAR
jgi:hypothetical protein